MAPRWTAKEKEKRDKGQKPSGRTQLALIKSQSRERKKERQVPMPAQVSFQPPVTPASFQQSVTGHQGPATAVPLEARQVNTQIHQSELAKLVADLHEMSSSMTGGLGELLAAMKHNPWHGPQPRGNAMAPELFNIANQHEWSTGFASTAPTASALGLLATPLISTSVDLSSLTPNADEDLSASLEFFQRYNEGAASSPQAETEIGQGLESQACIDLAHGIDEGLSDAMALYAEGGYQVEAVKDDLVIGEDDVEGFDFEQFFDPAGFDDADDGAGDESVS